MNTNAQQIRAWAMQVLEANPQGIRWAELLRAVAAKRGPGTPKVGGPVYNLVNDSPEIVKVARGTYRLAKFAAADDAVTSAEESQTVATPVKAETPGSESLTEQDFYTSFAEWLQENDEATVAVPLGGSSLGGKWGTPDVIGVLKPRAGDIFQFVPQIVTAEIKAVPHQPVVAFGQAVAYRLFSHKSYIVVPKSTASDDMERLKSLCSIHGVGLVTFTIDKVQPGYEVAVIPVNAVPDMFYINSMLENLKRNSSDILYKLF
jgi:hypothetical protein